MLKKSFDIADVHDDGGEILAYAATFDRVKDSYGDVIAPGAFTKTLADWQESGRPIPLLFGHRTDDPRMNIGAVIEAKEDEKGLLVRAQFDPDSEIAQYSRKLVKEGRLAKLSFAYEVKDAAPVTLRAGSKATELRELKIYEISLVPIPANDLTSVVDVKEAVGMTNAEFRAMRDGEITMDDIMKSNEVADETVSENVAEEPSEKSGEVEQKAQGDEITDAISAIRQLADRLDDIAEMIDDMAKRISILTDTPAVDDSADEAKACNEEARREGNSKAAEADAVLAKMAKYIGIN